MRYGSLLDGVDQIKSHEFFEGIDFEKILQKGMEAPYIPKERVGEDDSY